MSQRLRTVTRVVVFGAVLGGLLYREWQMDFFAKKNDALVGAIFIAIGVAAFYFRAKQRKTAPDLNQQLEPLAGYALPKVGQLAVLWLLVISGLGLIVWSQWP